MRERMAEMTLGKKAWKLLENGTLDGEGDLEVGGVDVH